MLYKTMVLALLEERTELYERLRQSRTLLPTLERLARELKAGHEAQKTLLSQATPGSDPSQLASEALEIALQELQDSLDFGSPDQSEPLSLDEAMAYLRRPTPPA